MIDLVVIGEAIDIVELEGGGADILLGDGVDLVEGMGGPRGPAGTGGAVFTQASPSAEWIVNHNLGRRPIVEVRNAGGSVIEADVLHVSTNQFRVLLAAPATGSASYL